MHQTIQTLNFLEASEIPNIAEQYGTPSFVYDLNTIKRRYQYFSQMPHAFGITVRYAVKANPNGAIIALFNELGAQFDVSSTWEAKRVIAAGVHPSKILMTAQETSSGWEELCSQGMEFDASSLTQLSQYGEFFPRSTVSLRINFGIGSGLLNRVTVSGVGTSFGVWHEKIAHIQQIIKTYQLSVKRLHFHIGSGNDGLILRQVVGVALAFCRHFPEISILNVGGGYKIAALSDDQPFNHYDTMQDILRQLCDFFAKTGRQLHLEIEPGTYLMAMSGSLITSVTDIVDTGNKGYCFIKINAGLTELVRPSYYGTLHPLILVDGNGFIPEKTMRAIVCGHCCEAGDNFTPKPSFPEYFEPVTLGEAKLKDYLVIERSGAYSASMCFKNFNSYPEALELMRYQHGQYNVIRNRQTLEQMMQNEVLIDFSSGLVA